MIFLCIVNHNHDELIINNETLPLLSKKYQIIIKSNTPATDALIKFTKSNKIQLINSHYGLGFGENNNHVFRHLNNNNVISDDDYFLVINPDVKIQHTELKKLQLQTKIVISDMYTINLYNDENYEQPELSIKKFPSIIGPIQGLISKIKRTDAYNKEMITEPKVIDWAAGSFLMFSKRCYESLNGFDESYFMYFEDVDICKRAKQEQMLLTYLPQVKAVHKGAYNNRKLFSQHFYWYLKSYFRYHIFKILFH